MNTNENLDKRFNDKCVIGLKVQKNISNPKKKSISLYLEWKWARDALGFYINIIILLAKKACSF